MNRFIKFIDSSVGKKLVMSLTGLFVFLFLIEHLVGNLLLLINDNGEIYTDYAEFMASPLNIPVRIIEIGLFVFLIYHIINGVRLAVKNKSVRKISYHTTNPSANSSFFSRFMMWSGSIIFIFLVVHLRSFFFPYRFGTPDNSLYQGVVEAFSNPIYSLFYILAMIFLAFHLIHGVQSAFLTLGIKNEKYTPSIKKTGIILSILICAGFALIPIVFLLRGGN